LLATLIQEAIKWLFSLMSELVGANVASLRKAFAAFFTLEGLFTRVPSLMGLESWQPVSLFASCVTVAWCVSFPAEGAVLTLRLPCCEKRWPHEGSLQICQIHLG
jgi:hypothetical protein